MSVESFLNKIREKKPSTQTFRKQLLSVLMVFAIGLAIGFIAKYSDTIPSNGYSGVVWGYVKDISTRMGIWIFLASIIAVFSYNPKMAGFKVLVFFIGMLITYYIYSALLFGFFPKYLFIRWGIIALASPFAAYVVWYGKGTGLIAPIISALPASLIAAQGFSFFYTYSPISGFDILLSVALVLILPNSIRQHLKCLLITIVLVFIIRHFDLMYILYV